MKLITLHLPEPYIRALDRLVREKKYPNRAEAIRHAVRDLLKTEAWKPKPHNEVEIAEVSPRRYVVKKK